jgi:hypothetical protein
VRSICVLLLALPAFAQGVDEELLARHSITPDRESIARYLGYMFPEAELKARIDFLIERLGDEDAGLRDAAMRELVGLHAAPLTALKRAQESASPEVRKIAGELIRRAESELDPRLLYVVFRTIRTKKLGGLTAEIVHAIPLASDYYVRREAEDALFATVGPGDLEFLLRAARDDAVETRVVALRALRRIDAAAARRLLVPALQDDSPEARIAAARELAELEDRRALPVLVELLSAADESVRFRAAWTLRAIAGKSFQFSAHGAPPSRAAAVAKWRTWLATEAKAVEWTTPIRGTGAKLGRTLVALYSKDRVVEFDSTGTLVWEKTGLQKPWAIHGLPNGHRLVSLYNEHRIVEFDASGTQIWKSAKLPGMVSSICGLRNGNILAATGHKNDTIIEISREKRDVVWTLVVPGRPICVQQLPNANLLVTLQQGNEVVEIDRSGRRLATIKGLKSPYSASRLDNGNTLVADNGARRIVEFDSEGRQVWEFKRKNDQGMQWCYTAARLRDGTTLYGDNVGLKRIDPSGEVVWQYKAANAYLYFHHY